MLSEAPTRGGRVPRRWSFEEAFPRLQKRERAAYKERAEHRQEVLELLARAEKGLESSQEMLEQVGGPGEVTKTHE